MQGCFFGIFWSGGGGGGGVESLWLEHSPAFIGKERSISHVSSFLTSHFTRLAP